MSGSPGNAMQLGQQQGYGGGYQQFEPGKGGMSGVGLLGGSQQYNQQMPAYGAPAHWNPASTLYGGESWMRPLGNWQNSPFTQSVQSVPQGQQMQGGFNEEQWQKSRNIGAQQYAPGQQQVSVAGPRMPQMNPNDLALQGEGGSNYPSKERERMYGFNQPGYRNPYDVGV